MTVPDWWEALLLAAAAFRTWRLIALDTILDEPRAWLVKRTGDYVDLFILCPWCSGFWIGLVWWGAWQWQSHWTLVVATPFVIDAAIALIAKNLDD